MDAFFDQLVHGLSDPVILFGHFTYALLIASMLMRRMVWLRALAVASGVTKIVYRAFFVIDPVSVLWETVFVLVNVIQLLIIWYYEYRHRFSNEQAHFAESMPANVERRAIRKMLGFSRLVEVAEGQAITTEGQPVKDLVYIASGVAKVETAGRVVAVCGPGDYIGELSFLTGAKATATTTAAKPVKLLAFDQAKLHQAIESDAGIRRAMEAGLNRNLVGKLVRSNTTHVAVTE
jgi:signal transduction histidine kinase